MGHLYEIGKYIGYTCDMWSAETESDVYVAVRLRIGHDLLSGSRDMGAWPFCCCDLRSVEHQNLYIISNNNYLEKSGKLL